MIGGTMKNRNGFTLIELLAVIALIALLSIVIVPSLFNLINRNNEKLDTATVNLIYSATEHFLDANQTEYIKADGAEYCPTIEELINAGFLDENLINIESGETYKDEYLNWIVKSTHNGYKYSYEIVETTTECKITVPDVTEPLITIGTLTYYRNTESNIKEKVYANVETFIKVPIDTYKIADGTELELRVRKGSTYPSGFVVTSQPITDNKTVFTIKVPTTAKIGEYVIEVTGGKAKKATQNFKIVINPIILLFMGD